MVSGVSNGVVPVGSKGRGREALGYFFTWYWGMSISMCFLVFCFFFSREDAYDMYRRECSDAQWKWFYVALSLFFGKSNVLIAALLSHPAVVVSEAQIKIPFFILFCGNVGKCVVGRKLWSREK